MPLFWSKPDQSCLHKSNLCFIAHYKFPLKEWCAKNGQPVLPSGSGAACCKLHFHLCIFIVTLFLSFPLTGIFRHPRISPYPACSSSPLPGSCRNGGSRNAHRTWWSRIGRDDLDMGKVGEVLHDVLHEFVADVSALVLRVNQNVVQECNGGAIVKSTQQSDQPFSIPGQNDVRWVAHRSHEPFGVSSRLPAHWKEEPPEVFFGKVPCLPVFNRHCHFSCSL